MVEVELGGMFRVVVYGGFSGILVFQACLFVGGSHGRRKQGVKGWGFVD